MEPGKEVTANSKDGSFDVHAVSLWVFFSNACVTRRPAAGNQSKWGSKGGARVVENKDKSCQKDLFLVDVGRGAKK